jgi:hypothetical protein
MSIDEDCVKLELVEMIEADVQLRLMEDEFEWSVAVVSRDRDNRKPSKAC